MKTQVLFFTIGVALMLLAGCVVGPDYQPPTMPEPVPAAFADSGPWREAAPSDHLPKGEWWRVYKDDTLNALIAQATDIADGKGNPSLHIALARVDQARALAGMDRAEDFPQVDGVAGASRARTPPGHTGNSFSIGVDLRYEFDIWGRVRRLTEAADARVAASEADYQTVLLLVQAETARVYFEMRTADAERALVVRIIESRRKSLDIVSNRQKFGADDRLSLSLAEAELSAAEGDLIEIDRLRAGIRHELAVLCGRNPTTFTINEDPTVALLPPPAIPVGLPSDLLERRPDISAAERALAAANADIGVAKAAFYPSVTLFGAAGLSSVDIEKLVEWESRAWSLGPAVSVPLFDGKRNTANYRRTQAVYDEALARYRQQVLAAFREVESCLGDLSRLAERTVTLERTVASSTRAAELMATRNRGGSVAYMDVTEAERVALANERLAVQVRGKQLVTSVLLIKAIGGGWEQ